MWSLAFPYITHVRQWLRMAYYAHVTRDVVRRRYAHIARRTDVAQWCHVLRDVMTQCVAASYPVPMEMNIQGTVVEKLV